MVEEVCDHEIHALNIAYDSLVLQGDDLQDLLKLLVALLASSEIEVAWKRSI